MSQTRPVPPGILPGLRQLPALTRDAILALGCALIGLPELVAHGGWSVRTVVALLAMSLPVLVQSRWPATVFVVLSAFAAIQWWADIRVLSDVSLLVVLTTLVMQRRTVQVIAALAVLEIGVVLAVVRWSGHATLLLILLNLAIASAVAIGVYLREHDAYLVKVAEHADQLERDRDREAQLAAAGERSRIAREMHDVVGHHLAVMVALADGAAAAQRGGADPTEALQQLSSTGRQALAETRSLVGILASPGDDRELPGALENIAGPVRLAGVPVRIQTVGAPYPLAPATDQVVRRVVQEALTNTLKHSVRPTDTSVELVYGPDVLDVVITDRGPVTAAPADPGMGLTGMRQRVAGCHGELQSGPVNGGWQVHARIPTPQRSGGNHA